MEHNKPKVAEVFPVGNMGLKPVPDRFKINELLEREEFYIYNPFSSGLSITKIPIQKVTYRALSEGFIMDSPEIIENLARGGESLEKFQSLSTMSNSLWPAAAEIFRRLIGTPKRNEGMSMDISPDMGLIVSKPTRKIDSPKQSRRPSPPTSGGR